MTSDGAVTKATNHSGGTLGGMTDGAPLTMRVAIKPTPSIASTQKTVNKSGEEINIEIGGREFVKTYSDTGFYIERDGARYSEAIDPADIPREYTETNEPIETDEKKTETEQKAEAFDYLTGRSDGNE